MDDLRLSETAYLNVPERDKSPSIDSAASSLSDISTAPINASRRKDQGGVTSHLVFAIVAASIGSAFQHGYNTGVVNAPSNHIKYFINETYFERFEETADEGTIYLIFSIMVSIFCLGGMMGGLMTAYVAEKFGRKGGLLLNNVFVFIGAALMGFSKICRSYEMMIMGRFFVGINSGLNAGLAPMYLTEISPVHLRGAVGTIYQLVITISILISIVLGGNSFMGTEHLWPVLFGIPAFASIFMLAAMPFCPESPKYILLIQGRDVCAQRALTWFRGTIEVHDEMDELRAEYESMKLVPKVTVHDMWYNPTLRQPLIIALVVMLSQQLSGINAIMYYSTIIFEQAGLSENEAQYSTLGMSIINVLMTVVSLVLVERAGRKSLLLIGLGGCGTCTFILAWCLIFHKQIHFLGYVSILVIFAYIIMFATGPGSIPWFLVAELFGAGARAMATSIAVGVNWSANFVVGLGFLPLSDMIGGYVFLVFTALLGIFCLFTYYKVPETKGKTIEEISSIFRQKAYQLN